MANQQQHNAAGMPVIFRIGIVIVALYFFAWGWDNFVQPQQAKAPASVSAQNFLRSAIVDTNARIWK